MKSVEVVEVWIWGTRVGALARDPRLNAYVFEYEEAWRRRGIELAPFMMPVTGANPAFVFPNLDAATFHRLPGMVSDALPDSFGNHLIDAWMATHGVPKDQITALDRLAYMGRRAMGALEFKPMRGTATESAAPIEMKELVEEARRAIRADLADDAAAQSALANIIRVGTSAGGARAKAVVAWNRQTNELCSGQFDVEPGFEHWLLKFDGVGDDFELGKSQSYGRREYAYYLMATAAGVQMSESRLLHENGRAHFMSRRFDRDGNRKRHVQSLCALQHMSFKQRASHAYESLFITADKLGLDADAMAQLFLRTVFNVAAKNHDDHTKNFAFVMDEGVPWQLSPAYDITHAYNPNGEWTRQHLMSVNGKFDAITARDLLTLASRFGVPSPRRLIEQVDEATTRWHEYAEQAELASDEAQNIARHIIKLG